MSTSVLIGSIVAFAVVAFGIAGIRIAQEYERGVVFRLGRYNSVRGPGLYWIIPLIEWQRMLDLRTKTVSVESQETITKDSVTIKAELPGVEAKDLDISVSGDVLTIKGEKRQEREEKDEHRHLVERSYGAFSRMVRLPAPVASDKAKASFKSGVLTITLPKTEEAKRKAIPIKVE